MGKIKDKLIGKHVNLRDVEVSDSKFILDLRTDSRKSKFLHKTEYDIEAQENYIKKYKNINDEYYFIIESKLGEPLGTIRIYDNKPDSFGSGSWLTVKNAPFVAAIEADYLMKKFGFETLGYNNSHFDVRKKNKKVVDYHKLMGAKIVNENDEDYFFVYTKDDFYKRIEQIENIIKYLAE